MRSLAWLTTGPKINEIQLPLSPDSTDITSGSSSKISILNIEIFKGNRKASFTPRAIGGMETIEKLRLAPHPSHGIR